MWIDPDNTKHFYIGGDGGIYETFDEGKNYIFKSNLPVSQFYRVCVDNALPFYNVTEEPRTIIQWEVLRVISTKTVLLMPTGKLLLVATVSGLQ